VWRLGPVLMLEKYSKVYKDFHVHPGEGNLEGRVDRERDPRIRIGLANHIVAHAKHQSTYQNQ
jgi:hypothetical protein